MGILTGPQIIIEQAMGRIIIEPFNAGRIRDDAGRSIIEPFNSSGEVQQAQPASYDIRMAPLLRFYTSHILDVKKDNPTENLVLEEEGTVLEPGRIYIGSTVEYIHTDYFVTTLEGKSSLGRLGLFVHSTAGWADPGFRGHMTLELTVTQPLRIYPDMLGGQLRYSTLVGPVALYKGKYQNQKHSQPSRSWQDFEQ